MLPSENEVFIIIIIIIHVFYTKVGNHGYDSLLKRIKKL